jgi:hypothetical protein
MGRRIGNGGVGLLLLEVGLALLVSAAGAWLLACKATPRWEPGLAAAVFGTFLTSMAIIAAFSIEERSRWPTPWELLDRAHVPAWLSVALVSVVVALLAAAIDSAFLNALGLTLTLVGLVLGARALWGIFSLSSDRGRHRLIVDRLAASIRQSEPASGSDDVDLGEVDTEDHVPTWFLGSDSRELSGSGGVSIGQVPSVLGLYADRREPGAIARLVEEVHDAAVMALKEEDWGESSGEYLERIDTLLSVQRGIFEELVRRVLSRQLEDAAVGSALARAGEAVLGIAGRARRSPRSYGPGAEPGAEMHVVRQLTALCRLAGSAVAKADEERGAAPLPELARRRAEGPPLAALHIACVNLQQAARWAIDPDPPGMKLPDDHPWHTGLSCPESALVWLWSAAESASGPYGVGLYALCEILTGRKFFDSYWEGYDVFTEIERRLAEADDDPIARRSRATLERAGGLARASLELAAARLAATPPHAAGATGSDGDRLVACNLFLAGGGYKPAGRDPIDDLAWLLTDRLSGSLWTMVHGQLGQLPDPIVRPPLRPLYLDPAACALALALRLTPLEHGAGEGEHGSVRGFVGQLPDSLLEETAVLARKLTGTGGEEPQAERSARVNAVVTAVEFVRKLAPDSSAGLGAAPLTGSSQPAAGFLSGPGPGSAAGCRGPDGFADVLRRLAATESPVEVDLIQCDPRWLVEWADLRSTLDAELLAAALHKRCRVRRVVLYEIPGDADRRTTRLHYRWTDALATAAGSFKPDEDSDGKPPRYRVRQLVLPYSGSGDPPPTDCVVLRGEGLPEAESPHRFEATWELFDPDARVPARGFGLVDLAGRGSPAPA